MNPPRRWTVVVATTTLLVGTEVSGFVSNSRISPVPSIVTKQWRTGTKRFSTPSGHTTEESSVPVSGPSQHYDIGALKTEKPVEFGTGILDSPLMSSQIVAIDNGVHRFPQAEADDAVLVHELQLQSPQIQMQQQQAQEQPYWCYWSTAHELTQAGAVGAATGVLVALFKLSIEAVRSICYEQELWVEYPYLLFTIPLAGGILVGLLRLIGGAFPPGLRGIVKDVDKTPSVSIEEQFRVQGNFLRKSSASIVTLGTGNSLGPEGPCVEIGLHCARGASQFNRRTYCRNDVPARLLAPQQPSVEQPIPREQQRGWNRILLAAGAASGVAAGFNAPIAGVFFALEIMQNAFQSIDQKAMEDSKRDNNNNNFSPPFGPMTATTTAITPILIASVTSALISQSILGNHLIFKLTKGLVIQTPLIELPLYLLLGALCGVVAFVFSCSAKVSQSFFAGELGPEPVKNVMGSIPEYGTPALGGLICGLVGLTFPQILFFGYETLNPLLNNSALPVSLIWSLLAVKTFMTAVCAGSGLVGGTFAPSLFLGAMSGAAYQSVAHRMVQSLTAFDSSTLGAASNPIAQFQESILPALQLADVPAYAMVGAASVLAALFRAPLTATLLLFEVTRNYDVLLPLMASAGVASIASDILEDTVQRREEMKRRDMDAVSWGALADVDDAMVSTAPVDVVEEGK